MACIDEALLDIGLSANEARILRQLDSAHGGSTAPWMCRALGMDPGQLSRELRNLKAHGLTQDRRESHDRRIKRIYLTPEGERLFTSVSRKLSQQVGDLLDWYDEQHQLAIVAAMRELSVILVNRRRFPTAHDFVPYKVPRLRRAD